MNMQDYIYNDPEELVSCPYNMAHSVIRARMATHLEKCRKQHPLEAASMKQCTYNVAHQIPHPEYGFHLSVCCDRHTKYTHNYKVGEESNDALNELLENIKKPIYLPNSEEYWDDDDYSSAPNIIERTQQAAKDRGVLRVHRNQPPSVKKSLREEDRYRAEETKITGMDSGIHKNCGTFSEINSSRSDTSSEASFVTALPHSHVSNSALPNKLPEDTIIDDLKNLHIEEKTLPAKGRSRPRSMLEQSLIGFGRGRGNSFLNNNIIH